MTYRGRHRERNTVAFLLGLLIIVFLMFLASFALIQYGDTNWTRHAGTR